MEKFKAKTVRFNYDDVEITTEMLFGEEPLPFDKPENKGEEEKKAEDTNASSKNLDAPSQ